MAPVGAARYMADRIPHAELVELEGRDHYHWAGDWHAIADEVQKFLQRLS